MTEPNEKLPYAAPVVRSLGTIEQLTEAGSNKVGSANDQFTALTGGAIVGSIVPQP